MSKRLGIERQKLLEPKRIAEAKQTITELGYEIIEEDPIKLVFLFKGKKVMYYPYSGWHTGKSIVDGRGIKQLLNQIKDEQQSE